MRSCRTYIDRFDGLVLREHFGEAKGIFRYANVVAGTHGESHQPDCVVYQRG